MTVCNVTARMGRCGFLARFFSPYGSYWLDTQKPTGIRKYCFQGE